MGRKHGLGWCKQYKNKATPSPSPPSKGIGADKKVGIDTEFLELMRQICVLHWEEIITKIPSAPVWLSIFVIVPPIY